MFEAGCVAPMNQDNIGGHGHWVVHLEYCETSFRQNHKQPIDRRQVRNVPAPGPRLSLQRPNAGQGTTPCGVFQMRIWWEGQLHQVVLVSLADMDRK